MDSSGASFGVGSCILSFLQYTCMLLAVVAPVVWKLYTISSVFRFYTKQVIYMGCVMLTSWLTIPLAMRDPYNPDNTRYCEFLALYLNYQC